jgi:hypothetical protein
MYITQTPPPATVTHSSWCATATRARARRATSRSTCRPSSRARCPKSCQTGTTRQVRRWRRGAGGRGPAGARWALFRQGRRRLLYHCKTAGVAVVAAASATRAAGAAGARRVGRLPPRLEFKQAGRGLGARPSASCPPLLAPHPPRPALPWNAPPCAAQTQRWQRFQRAYGAPSAAPWCWPTTAGRPPPSCPVSPGARGAAGRREGVWERRCRGARR